MAKHNEGLFGLGGYASEEEEEEDNQVTRHSQGRTAGILDHYSNGDTSDHDNDAGSRGNAPGSPSTSVPREQHAATSGDASSMERTAEDAQARANELSDDPFSRLPPELREPPGQCSPELEQYVRTLLDKSRSGGLTINDSLRSKKDYRNPDLLQKLVEHFNVQQTGSAFPKDIFDSAGLPAEDYINELVNQLEREQQQRQQRRAQLRPDQPGGGIEFTKGTSGLGSLPASSSANDLRAQQLMREQAQRNLQSSLQNILSGNPPGAQQASKRPGSRWQ